MSVVEALRTCHFRFAVTGAGGWLGRMALAMLEEAFAEKVTERVVLFGSRARDLESPGGRKLVCRPLKEILELPAEPTLLLHFAFETKDRVAGYALEDFVRRNTEIDDAVLAATEKIPLGGAFVPSSGAVYRPDRSQESDPAANPYGAMKRRQEERWAAWSRAHGTPLAAIRVFNLAGPYINKFDTYVLASILLNLLRGEPVRLNATRPVIRSYVHVRDLMALAFALLLDRTAPVLEPFDTAGEEEIEIGELAKRAALVLGRPGHAVVRPPVGGPANRYVGAGESWGRLMARYGLKPAPLEAQIADTAAFLKTYC